MMKFKAHLKTLKKPQAYVANRFGISQGYLNLLASGKRTPGLKLALRIESVTQGAVPVSSWAEPTTPPKEENEDEQN